MSLFRKATHRLRESWFPSEFDRELQRWQFDGGNERFRYDYHLNNDSLVMDLGGYKGQWTSDIYGRYNCHVLVFEPVRLFAEKIERRFRENPKIEVFNFALGESRRQEIIALSDDGSSLYRNASAKDTIQFEDVADFFTERNIKNIDLMKVNIEGGEYELLPRLFETNLINRIQNIQIQFHDVLADSESRMNRICEDLSKTHYPTYRYKFVWENWVRHEDSLMRK